MTRGIPTFPTFPDPKRGSPLCVPPNRGVPGCPGASVPQFPHACPGGFPMAKATRAGSPRGATPDFGRGHRDELLETPKTPASSRVESPGGEGRHGGERIIYSKIRKKKQQNEFRAARHGAGRGEHPNTAIAPPRWAPSRSSPPRDPRDPSPLHSPERSGEETKLFGSARLGSASLGCARSGSVRLLGSVRLCSASLG